MSTYEEFMVLLTFGILVVAILEYVNHKKQHTDRVPAGIALAEYNRSSYDQNDRKKLFNEVFTSWYQWKYKVPLTAHTFNVLLDSAGVDRVTR